MEPTLATESLEVIHDPFTLARQLSGRLMVDGKLIPAPSRIFGVSPP
jgi:hypothetical protein